MRSSLREGALAYQTGLASRMRVCARRLRSIGIASLTLLAACGGEHAADRQGIKVGFFGALTGPTATFAISGKNGAMLAVAEINAAGGVLGKPIVLLSEDDRGEAAEAASAVSKLITRDHVVALIGENASSRTLAAAPIAQSYKVPMISPSSTNVEVTKKGDYVFRVCFIDPYQGLRARDLRAPGPEGADRGDPRGRAQRLLGRPRRGLPLGLRGRGRPDRQRAQVRRGRQRLLRAADRDAAARSRRPDRPRLLHGRGPDRPPGEDRSG